MQESLKISYDGYLTEDKMVDALTRSGLDVKREFMIPGYRYRYDAVFDYNGTRYFVEFHGNDHYTKADVQFQDRHKEDLANAIGKYVAIPYFIQLTNETWSHFFGFAADVVSDYAHGFIDKKATLPGSFNSSGMIAFSDFLLFPKMQNVADDIIKSLGDHVLSGTSNDVVFGVFGFSYVADMITRRTLQSIGHLSDE